jgi:hypothetical protein
MDIKSTKQNANLMASVLDVVQKNQDLYQQNAEAQFNPATAYARAKENEVPTIEPVQPAVTFDQNGESGAE